MYGFDRSCRGGSAGGGGSGCCRGSDGPAHHSVGLKSNRLREQPLVARRQPPLSLSPSCCRRLPLLGAECCQLPNGAGVGVHKSGIWAGVGAADDAADRIRRGAGGDGALEGAEVPWPRNVQRPRRRRVRGKRFAADWANNAVEEGRAIRLCPLR